MLDFAILGILTDGPLHGYELKRVLADSEHGFWTVSFGSLYPALRRLERKGLIATAGDTGRRKSYALTPAGRAAFTEMLAEPPPEGEDDRSFSLRLAFFRYLEPDARLGVLEGRRAQLVQRLARARASLKRRGTKAKERMDRYTLSLMEHGVKSAEADIAWLDELIETERADRPARRRRTARGGPESAHAQPEPAE